MIFPSSNTVVVLYADSGYYMDPNYTSGEPNLRQYFKDHASGSMSDECHVLEAEDPSAVHSEGTQAMFIVVTVAVGDGLGYVTTVYLYTSEPGADGVSGTTSPQQNTIIQTDPPKEGGEWGGWVIPVIIVDGLAVVGGAVALALRGRKKDGSDPDPGDSQQEEPRSTFRMQLYKEFGDTLFVGANAETVGARIEEVRADGTVLDRPDLTARITFGASNNLEAQAIGMQGRYQCLNVKATSADSPTAIVAITFAGGAARLRIT